MPLDATNQTKSNQTNQEIAFEHSFMRKFIESHKHVENAAIILEESRLAKKNNMNVLEWQKASLNYLNI